jgi:hypothetical protein
MRVTSTIFSRVGEALPIETLADVDATVSPYEVSKNVPTTFIYARFAQC